MEYLIKTNSIGGMTDEQFFNFCQENDMLRIERNANGDIILMAPIGSETGWFNLGIASALYNWSVRTGQGYAFDSSTSFTLPNTAVRSADAAFIKKDRWEAIPKTDRKGFSKICPDFVIEILSDSDNRNHIQNKMKEWIDNGCHLAWLIDPDKKVTTVFKPDHKPITVPFDQDIDGGDLLPGFTLHVKSIIGE